jgi:glycosyltransferase involved in cell wall biosynthesis
MKVQSDGQRHRLTLVIGSLSCGGAERVMSVLANSWASMDKEVTLITMSSTDLDWYILNPAIRRIGLNLRQSSPTILNALLNNIRRIHTLRREIKSSSPDMVLSFGDSCNVLTVLACIASGIPVVISERADWAAAKISKPVWAWLRNAVYRLADLVVVPSRTVAESVRGFVSDKRLWIIPNPIAIALPERKARDSQEKIIVSVGRLSPEKGFDLLVRAFAACASLNPGWSLIIYGEGEQRATLERLIEDLQLKDRVSLPGQVREPVNYIWTADLFVLSSYTECFPNALCEAMAVGLPVIATDCPSGPREIIRHGVDGILVAPNDVYALSAAMHGLLNDPDIRDRLGSHAREVTERFGLEKVIGMWNALFKSVSPSSS